MFLLPLRLMLRNRWLTLVWAAGICFTAANFASDNTSTLDAANASDGNAAQAGALLAEGE